MAAVVNIVATLPGSAAPAAGATLTVEHITGVSTPGHTGAGEILGTETITLDENGEHSLTLEPCVDDLEGTIYVVRHGNRSWRLQPITDGTWLIGDPEIQAPGGAPGVQWVPGPPGSLGVVDDIVMPDATVSGGTADAGAVRNLQALVFKDWDYTQTTPPTDVAVGTAVHVPWDATVSAGSALTATGWFGPRAVFNQEGLVRYGVNQTAFTFGPIGFGDLLRQANTPGVARTLVPAWSFLSSRAIIADGAIVSLGANDTNRGGAAFVNNAFYVSINGGQILDTSGTPTSMVGFSDAPLIAGNVDIGRRIAYEVKECKTDSSYRDILDSASGAPPLTGNMDPSGGETLLEQVGLNVEYMSTATRNIGIKNASAYVAPPQTSTISGASSTIRIDAEYVVLDVTAGASVTLTGTPIMADGLAGQEVTLINSSSSYTVTLSGERAGSTFAAVASTNISDYVILGPHATVKMRYDATTALWHPVSVFQPQSQLTPGGAAIYSALGDRYPRVSMGQFLTVSFLNMGAGGSSDTDTYLSRLSAGVFGVGSSLNGSTGKLIGRVTNPGRTVTGNTTFAATDIGGLVVANSGSAIAFDIPLHATVNTADYDTIRFINRGAGTLTITHTGGTIVTGSTTSFAQGKSGIATRLASNVWQVE